MHPVLQSCQLLIRLVAELIAGVIYLGCGYGRVWEADSVVTRAAARRLAAGLRLAQAYLRRVLVVMALELEPTLIDPLYREPCRRPERAFARKAKMRRAVFVVFQNNAPFPGALLAKMVQNHQGGHSVDAANKQVMPICIRSLKARLACLAKIAGDPLPRARRLAFYLARKKPGPLFAPAGPDRPPQSLGKLRKLWNTATSATFDAMAMDIHIKSRARPPPMQPRHRHGPSILVMGG
jgi:hypothetical protein